MSGLSRAEEDFFNTNGYIGPFKAWEITKLDQKWPAILSVMLERPSVCYGVYTSRDRHLDSKTIYEICSCEEIIGRVSSLIPGGTILWRSLLFVKKLGDAPILPHRDFPSPGPLGIPAYLENQGITAWLALTETTKSNGCLFIVPGSHRYNNGDIKLTIPVFFELKPGEFILFDVNTLHGSMQNSTNAIRIGLSIRFCSDKMELYPDHPRRVVQYPNLSIRIDGGGFNISKWHALEATGPVSSSINPIDNPPTTDDYTIPAMDRLIECTKEWLLAVQNCENLPPNGETWQYQWLLMNGRELEGGLKRASQLQPYRELLDLAKSLSDINNLIQDFCNGNGFLKDIEKKAKSISSY